MSKKPVLRVGGVPEHFNLPWHQAIQANAFADLDVAVEFIEYPGGTGAMTSDMKHNHLDLALLLFEGAVANILRGNPNRLVKVYVDSPLIWGIHVAADSAIETVAEIQDKVYAISRAGSGSHLIAVVDAAERNWPTDQMKFSKVDNLTGAREKLASGKVDVFLWEKYTTQFLVDAKEFRRVGERVVPWPAFVVSVRDSVLNQNAESIKQILDIVDEYCLKLKSDPRAEQIIAERFDIKPADCASWFSHVKWSHGFTRPDQSIQMIFDYLKRLNLVEGNMLPLDRIWRAL